MQDDSKERHRQLQPYFMRRWPVLYMLQLSSHCQQSADPLRLGRVVKCCAQ